MNPFKDLTCNQVVTTLGQPPAALVAPSEVEAESHFWKTTHHRIVHLHPHVQPLI